MLWKNVARTNVAVVERWVAVGLFALGGTLWAAREAPAAPARATRPAVKVGPHEARQIEVGRRLFFEPSISAVGKNSCASCHDPEHGFSDPAVKSRDDFSLTPRHSQTVVDVDTSMALHWDGGIKDLNEIIDRRTTEPEGGGYDGSGITPSPDFEPQRLANEAVRRHLGSDVQSAALNPGVMTTSDGDLIIFGLGALRGGGESELPGRYREAFDALGTPRKDALRGALAAYVKSLRSSASAFDRWAGGDDQALSEPAKRGHDLFAGRAGCSACHLLEHATWPMLRDGKYHNTGVAWTTAGEDHMDGALSAAMRRIRRGMGLAAEGGDPGRGAHQPRMVRAFKTPSLRDVAVRPPYMHDGSLATLADVVKHYAAGCGTDPKRDGRLRGGFLASDQDVADLVAFLEALTSDERPGLAKERWKHRAARTRLTLVDSTGAPLAGLDVTVAPAGDRAFRGAQKAAPRAVRSDANGQVEFEPTDFTHVRLDLPQGLEPRGGRFVPDTCKEARLVVPVDGRVRLVLQAPWRVDAPAELHAYALADESDAFRIGVDFAGPVKGPPSGKAPQLVRPTPLVFVRVAATERPESSVLVYEGWVPTDGSKTVLLRLPGQHKPQAITLATGEQRIQLAGGR